MVELRSTKIFVLFAINFFAIIRKSESFGSMANSFLSSNLQQHHPSQLLLNHKILNKACKHLRKSDHVRLSMLEAGDPNNAASFMIQAVKGVKGPGKCFWYVVNSVIAGDEMVGMVSDNGEVCSSENLSTSQALFELTGVLLLL